VTERLKGLVSRWRDVSALSDDAAAATVVEDRIDVLVDLAGHTARNRLALFARRPAPVQVTYLGYATTTGLPAMDYRVTDGWVDPQGFEPHSCERLWRLPSGWLCFPPPPEAPPVAPPPCLTAGHTTFGSFNNLAKVGPAVVELWAAVLHRVEGALLLLKNGSLRDPDTCGRVRDRFAAAGVDPTRLELVGMTPTAEAHFALYHRVDIGLDPFPYGGGTTTCEALWMGVPVVTLAGNRSAARFGVSTLSSLGLEGLIGADGDAYVALAAELAADPDRLASLRSTLRDRMAAAPTLCRPDPFTRELEQAYRGMVETVWDEGRR
jgi:predicted O-linked N-acetylglucosamine transferase (SPINDLY family)